MTGRRFEVFRDARPILAESLVWDPEGDAILWCDISAGLLHRSGIHLPRDGSGDETLELPPPLASFHPAVEGGYVASLGDRVVRVADDGSFDLLAEVELGHPEMRLNEGKVDPLGRWVTGSMDLADNQTGDGSFVAVDAAGDVVQLIGGIGVANGLEWDDAGHIWFTDTSVSTIYRGRYDADGIRDVLPWHQGAPHDGLTRAADGTFWGAQYGTGMLVHYDTNADELETLLLPAPNLTSVVLDGAGTLYVASAREKLSEGDLVDNPLSGAIFAIATSTPGLPPRVFGAP